MPDVFNCCLLFLCCFEQKYAEMGEEKLPWELPQALWGRLVSDIPPAQGAGRDKAQTRSPLPKLRLNL